MMRQQEGFSGAKNQKTGASSAEGLAKFQQYQGSVVLAGAGPGDPDLLTRKAIKALRKADAVLYDRLIDPAVLRYARNAIKIPVGKKPGRCQETRQRRIHQLMVYYARKGYNIVRLKGGDPFIFGRGGEELQILRNAGIQCEVIPGISSFYSVPENVGIPLTFRGISTAFGVFTGHEADRTSGIAYDAAARIPTAVFLMGVKKLPEISRQLILHGRAPETPVAIIRNGTRSNQEVRITDLATAPHLEGLASPSIIVVGEVVHALGISPDASSLAALTELANEMESAVPRKTEKIAPTRS